MAATARARAVRASVLASVLAGALALAACARRATAPAAAPQPPSSVTVADILKLAKDPAAKVVLVNVWASWCAPCREELPALVKLHREMEDEGLRMILVSADFDVPGEKLSEFLASQGVDFPTYIRTEKDEDFMRKLSPDWTGAIPATFLYSGGELVDFWEGMATYEAFETKVRAAMGSSSSAG